MKNQVCIWYPVCPMRRFYEAGELEEYWVETYCLAGNPGCVRKQMESKGIPHPDNMLPDGTIREGLF
ncbi:hypothetical protein [Marispirochaeta aestuarii]|uniref:hypothetical protein n=1 Tax=Marispirochaeta aestuarii TaxID=1963862 RepID=UPI0029C800DE|nr:hypothetical protein [Marispirochaeta aestuarii]